jgi:hypothetical protein
LKDFDKGKKGNLDKPPPTLKTIPKSKPDSWYTVWIHHLGRA